MMVLVYDLLDYETDTWLMIMTVFNVKVLIRGLDGLLIHSRRVSVLLVADYQDPFQVHLLCRLAWLPEGNGVLGYSSLDE